MSSSAGTTGTEPNGSFASLFLHQVERSQCRVLILPDVPDQTGNDVQPCVAIHERDKRGAPTGG